MGVVIFLLQSVGTHKQVVIIIVMLIIIINMSTSSYNICRFGYLNLMCQVQCVVVIVQTHVRIEHKFIMFCLLQNCQ